MGAARAAVVSGLRVSLGMNGVRMEEGAGHIGLLSVRVFIGEARSLKDKRAVLRRLKDRVRSSFNVSVAELAGQDKWQVAQIGFVMIGNERAQIESTLQAILNLMDSYHPVEICEHNLEFF